MSIFVNINQYIYAKSNFGNIADQLYCINFKINNKTMGKNFALVIDIFVIDKSYCSRMHEFYIIKIYK